jgi:hypothetical protein
LYHLIFRMMPNPWDALAGFESRDLIEQFLRKRHGHEPKPGKVLEVASSFNQGREYFRSAAEASISVKPLLLYYGVLALSRGLILALTPGLRESALKPSHGLEVANWQESLAAKDFARLQIRLQNGTFSELVKAVDNKSYFRYRTNGINWAVRFPQPKANSTINFYELATGFPDLDRELLAWTNGSYRHATLMETAATVNNEVKLTLGGSDLTESDIETFLPLSIFPEKRTELVGRQLTVWLTKKAPWPRLVYRQAGPASWAGMGDIHMVQFFQSCDPICDIGQAYLAAYVMGMMSRYFPTAWISLGRTEKGDAVYPFILKLIKHIESHFPQMVLDHLDGPYKFETKAVDIE